MVEDELEAQDYSTDIPKEVEQYDLSLVEADLAREYSAR